MVVPSVCMGAAYTVFICPVVQVGFWQARKAECSHQRIEFSSIWLTQ